MTTQVLEKPVEAIVVSDYILWKRKGKPTTNLDVIKLVYLSHGWHLGIYGEPLITEPVEAWTYGPVIRSVYDCFKTFGGRPINVYPRDNSNLLSVRQRLLIDETLRTYNAFDSWELSAITHEKGSPWDQVTGLYGTVGSSNTPMIIPNDIIQEHYGSLYKDYHAAQR
ncbi:MAG: DUF4065 domain-containing protein [Bacteroidetes bacterium]|nr:DUF4065 domain-containing protein [Bacteroidota bacterium]MDE2671324.1 DUF4065 domain-containing protein [Bacteroidota bacterium]